MLDRREDENSGLLFSPQPKPEPEMLGARNVDSVLFDVGQLQQAARDNAAARAGDEQNSGLVDVNSLIDPDAVADDGVVEKTAALVEEIKARPEAPEPVADNSRGLMIATIVLATLLLLGLVFVATR